MNIYNVLFDSYKTYQDQPCLIFNETISSYHEVVERVRKCAQGLGNIGVCENDRVAIMVGNKPEYIISYFSILSVGAIVVPINPLFSEREASYILNNAEVKVAIVDNTSLSTVVNAFENCPFLEKIIPVDSKGMNDQNHIYPFSNLLQYGPKIDICPRSTDDTAQIIYTSGTTGNPKGAMITHGNLSWMAEALNDLFEVTNEDRVLCVLPLFHAYAKLQCFLSPIRKGASIYLVEKFDAGESLSLIDKQKISLFFGVPAMFIQFVNSPQVGRYEYNSLRLCVSGGASIPVEIIKKVKENMKIDIVEGYGMTETTVLSTCNPYRGLKKYGSIGVPLPGLEMQVVSDKGEPIPVGEKGELLVKGPNVMKGYYKKELETNKTIVNGWLYTGDIARMDEDGYLYIVDRKKELIIRNGFNVYPREIEEVLYMLPQVEECAIVGVPDEKHGEEIAAYLVVKASITEEEIQEHYKKLLVPYKWPRMIHFIDQLPKTPSGKIMKKVLRTIDSIV
ncbi:long-chain-fatty-acid--CoA ligase [Peribacillus frigoritolerans]|uniref:long-chain-fatty-acid--CoA ligase n=1 Tax=Peribacillus frigoritolerans TaxID=450367 RepID=UPI0037FE65FB